MLKYMIYRYIIQYGGKKRVSDLLLGLGLYGIVSASTRKGEVQSFQFSIGSFAQC